jgi:outer membrane lipoprotein SlyB
MMRSKASLYAILMFAVALGVLAGCSRKPTRTDAQIAVEVQNKIYSDSVIQSRQIEVQAANSVVTLTGDVSDDTERALAAHDAATVEGVRTVVNDLQVQQARATPPTKAPSKRSKAYRSETDASGARQSNTKANDGVNSGSVALQADNTPPPAPSIQQSPPPPQPPAPPKKVTIPAGTQLTIRLNAPLDSERNQVGDTFHGSLSNPIVLDGETVIPSGADVVGRVADVKSAGRFAGNSVLTLELTSLSVNGRTYNIQTNQWTRAGSGEGKNTATKVGVGTAAGAVLGGIFGGGRGAAIGAAAGAGAGTGVAASKKGQQIQLSAEAVLNFQTINSLTVTPQDGNERNKGRTPLS